MKLEWISELSGKYRKHTAVVGIAVVLLITYLIVSSQDAQANDVPAITDVPVNANTNTTPVPPTNATANNSQAIAQAGKEFDSLIAQARNYANGQSSLLKKIFNAGIDFAAGQKT